MSGFSLCSGSRIVSPGVNSPEHPGIFHGWEGFRMSLLQTGMGLMSKQMPKVIGPKTHAIIDYGMAASFIAMGALFWKRNKRAAISSFICGGATAINSMLTNYPGGVWKQMSFETHGKIDAGLVGATGTMPALMGFKDESEAKFFEFQAVAEAAVTAMTDFHAMDRTDYYRHGREDAA
jgi:hypothetical protein